MAQGIEAGRGRSTRRMCATCPLPLAGSNRAVLAVMAATTVLTFIWKPKISALPWVIILSPSWALKLYEVMMPIRYPAPNPPFNIVRLSHIELGVANLAASPALLCGHLGPA